MESSAGRAEDRRYGGEWLVRIPRSLDSDCGRLTSTLLYITGNVMFALNQAMCEDLLL